MLRILLLPIFVGALAGCDAQQPADTVYSSPELRIVEFPFDLSTLDERLSGANLLSDEVCVISSPGPSPSICWTGIKLGVTGGASLLHVRDGGTALEIDDGFTIGPYPTGFQHPPGFPFWHHAGWTPNLVLLTKPVSQTEYEITHMGDSVYYGLRFLAEAAPGEWRYGWIRLTGTAEPDEAAPFGFRLEAIVHEYAIGAPGKPVFAGRRP